MPSIRGFMKEKVSRSIRMLFQVRKHEKIKGNVLAQPSLKGFPIRGVSGQASETPCVVSTHRLSLKERQKDERDGLAATF